MNALAPLEKAVDIAPLRHFVMNFANLLSSCREEGAILQSGSALLEKLVSHDGWLPDEYARPNPDRYQQYLLHCDSRERFSIVSFVWAPGQSTPIHDHRVWGLVGILRGVEKVERFRRGSDGMLFGEEPDFLRQGEVEAFSPRSGDIHRVSNGRPDAPSVSIHVYGANIGAVERATFAPDGTPKPFISGYANSHLPNLWDRSKAS